MPRGSLCSGRGLTLRRWRAGWGQGAAGSRSIRWFFGRTEFFFTIRCDGGTDKKCLETFAYREIAAPERIVFVNSLADEKGGTARSPDHPKRPLEIRNTSTLTEHEGKTTLNLGEGRSTRPRRNAISSRVCREAMQKGFGGTFDRLDEYLSKA